MAGSDWLAPLFGTAGGTDRTILRSQGDAAVSIGATRPLRRTAQSPLGRGFDLDHSGL